MLYRVLLPVLLLAATATPAPQDVTNSDITYVKVQPLNSDDRNIRESKIENIPEKKTEEKGLESDEAKKLDAVQSDITAKNNRSEISLKNNRTEIKPDQFDPELDTEHSGSDLADAFATDDTLDNFPSDSILSRTKIDYTTAVYDSGETTETAEPLTERNEEEREFRKYPTSRSFPKFSNKRKANGFSFTANLIEKSEKRKFRSTCKCMKIWNCPKLQISVGRCAEEFFLCCF